tara:strand:+ start:27175 stop:28569 length:1395 start_codon:yes stop_codon:yes gene_type:complete
MTDQQSTGAIVIGGGLTGLYAGLTLARAGTRVTILEAEEDLGGRIRGHRVGQNTLTLGTQLLQSFDRVIFDDVTSLLTQRAEVEPSESILWGGQRFAYPLSLDNFFKGLSFAEKVGGALGKSGATLGQKVSKKPPIDAEHALARLYGSALTRRCFSNWLDVFFGRPGKELSPEIISLLLPQLPHTSNFADSVESLGLKAFDSDLLDREVPEHSVYFPTSSGVLATALAAAIQRAGGRIICNAEVVGLDVEDGEIRSVQCRDKMSGSEEPTIHQLPCEGVISTISVRKLVKAFNTHAPAQIHASSLHLQHRGHVCFALVLSRSNCLEEISLQVRDQPFFRISEPKNAGQQVAPVDQTILLVEAATEPNSSFWNGDEQAWSEILDALEHLGICKRAEVVSRHHLSDPMGIPIYRLEFEEHRDRLFSYFARFPNLQCAGPGGTFSMMRPDQAMKSGARGAELLCEVL